MIKYKAMIHVKRNHIKYNVMMNKLTLHGLMWLWANFFPLLLLIYIDIIISGVLLYLESYKKVFSLTPLREILAK